MSKDIFFSFHIVLIFSMGLVTNPPRLKLSEQKKMDPQERKTPEIDLKSSILLRNIYNVVTLLKYHFEGLTLIICGTDKTKNFLLILKQHCTSLAAKRLLGNSFHVDMDRQVLLHRALISVTFNGQIRNTPLFHLTLTIEWGDSSHYKDSMVSGSPVQFLSIIQLLSSKHKSVFECATSPDMTSASRVQT